MVKVGVSDQVCTVSLNRPDKHNALNKQLIRDLTNAFANISTQARLVVLNGEGASFCAGADIQYMREQAAFTPEENTSDARALSALFKSIRNCSVPVVGVVHGNAFGGGAGLAAACDILLCQSTTRFCFSEAKIGLAPAVISPYVIARMGAAHARRYFLTAEVFSGDTAQALGLANFSGDSDSLANELSAIVSHITASGPVAIQKIKRMLNTHYAQHSHEDDLCQLIAEMRTSPEGQEGLTAFLEKRKPEWAPGR